MPKKATKRSLQAANTKQRILAAALKLFDEHGVENVSINDISEAAQCSSGNIYHYFKSKDHIIACLNQPRDDEYLEFKERLDSDGQYASLSPVDKLIAFFVFMCTAAARDTDNMSKLYIYALKYKDQNVLLVDKSRDVRNIYIDLLTDIMNGGRLDPDADCDELTQNIVILCRGILMELQIGKGDFDVAEKSRHMISAYLAGILK